MFSVGIGPSSSHTVGPMRAAKSFCDELTEKDELAKIDSIVVELFGSLGLTSKGHGTGKAVILGLLGFEPETVDVRQVEGILAEIEQTQKLKLNNTHSVKFPNQGAIVFHRRKSLPLHANGMTIHAYQKQQAIRSQTYYSIGGGFVVKHEDFQDAKNRSLEAEQRPLPYSFSSSAELITHCKENGLSVSALMLKNETTVRSISGKSCWNL